YRISWVRKGWLLFSEQRYDEVLDWCQRSQRWLPKDVSMLNIRGAALSRLDRKDEAIAVYDRAIQLQPKHADSWYNRACVYADLEEVETAIANLQYAIELKPALVDEAKTDEGFAAIRHRPDFQALLQ
ncbi:MAG: tetratricopeptide repeat protein, partial [Leptolyngbya sp. SIO1D8]|nr:tetratricopeptide repeat protein [Leptolyngbya sp. SIO1D8]